MKRRLGAMVVGVLLTAISAEAGQGASQHGGGRRARAGRLDVSAPTVASAQTHAAVASSRR